MAHVKRRLETLAAERLGGVLPLGVGASGLAAAIPRVCLPGRSLLPVGIHDAVVPIHDS